jgi:Raf kinase inhibitor-like YbhB/YbcL family protein
MMQLLGRFFGRRMRKWRAGSEWRVSEDIRFSGVPRTIELRSPAFAFGEPMPATKESPPLEWSGVPPQTKTLALVVQDVDVPLLRPLTHAIAYEIDPATTSLPAGALNGKTGTRSAAEGDDLVTMGYDGGGGRGYIAPAPIPGHGVHRYVFTLLAVDFLPRFDQPPTKGRLLDAIAGHVAALGELMGTVER